MSEGRHTDMIVSNVSRVPGIEGTAAVRREAYRYDCVKCVAYARYRGDGGCPKEDIPICAGTEMQSRYALSAP